MVPRCGYFVDNGKVKRDTVEIDWNLGWDRAAKEMYVKDLHAKLLEKFPGKKVVEVTTAATGEGRSLSPMYIRFSDGASLEDIWKVYTELYEDVLVYDNFKWKKPLDWRAFTHYYCMYADVRLGVIRKYDVFSDVFYNPTKAGGTQALACACLKLLDQQGNMSVRDSLETFCEWYDTYIEI